MEVAIGASVVQEEVFTFAGDWWGLSAPLTERDAHLNPTSKATTKNPGWQHTIKCIPEMLRRKERENHIEFRCF